MDNFCDIATTTAFRPRSGRSASDARRHMFALVCGQGAMGIGVMFLRSAPLVGASGLKAFSAYREAVLMRDEGLASGAPAEMPEEAGTVAADGEGTGTGANVAVLPRATPMTLPDRSGAPEGRLPDSRLDVAPAATIELSADTVRREPRPPEGPDAPAVPAVTDNEAERIAFTLWREGRADEAIAMLEREILIEKDRAWKDGAASAKREPHFGEPAPEVIIVPPAPTADAKPPRGKRRKRGGEMIAVSEPVFSDASASAPLIDVGADAADHGASARQAAEAMIARERVGRGPAVIALLGLVVVGLATAAYLWDGRHPHGTGGPAQAETAVDVNPSGTPATAEAAPQATTQPAAPQTAAAPAPAQNSDTAASAPAADATPENAAVAALHDPDPDAAPTDADAAAGTDADDDVPTPGAAADAPPPEDATETADAAMVPAPADGPRLPRQRPQAPATASAETTTAAPVPVVRNTPSLATMKPVAPASSQAAAKPKKPAPAPAVAADTGAIARYDDAERLPMPFYGRNGEPQRETLTPAQYQALLHRRTAAERYVAQEDDPDAPPPWEQRRRSLLWLRGE
jgi:hypothetical protein